MSMTTWSMTTLAQALIMSNKSLEIFMGALLATLTLSVMFVGLVLLDVKKAIQQQSVVVKNLPHAVWGFKLLNDLDFDLSGRWVKFNE